MKSKMYQVRCEKCESEWMIKVESIIHAQSESMAREMLLEEAFFSRKCSRCGHVMTIYYPFLYIDSKQCFLLTLCDKEAQWLKEIESLEKYATFQKRIVQNQVVLKECILIFEQGLDDRSIALMKASLQDKYTYLMFESSDINYLWFQSNNGPVGIERKYYQELYSKDTAFISV